MSDCKTKVYSSKEGFNESNRTFEAGKVYGIQSKYGNGGWAYANCIGGRIMKDYDGTLWLNEKKITPPKLLQYSCFISDESLFKEHSRFRHNTVRDCISRALERSGVGKTVDDVRRLFDLSKGRFERSYKHQSGEIWRASMAMGFAANRMIFIYPWIISPYEQQIIGGRDLIKALKDHGKIVVIPMDDKEILESVCDEIILVPRPTDNVDVL